MKGIPMRKALFVPLAALAVLGLSGCGKKAANEAAEANESVAGDSNTMGEAVTDVNAAENAAFGAAENAYADVPADEGSGDGDGNEIAE
jgi:hypothetical protein